MPLFGYDQIQLGQGRIENMKSWFFGRLPQKVHAVTYTEK
jgi:hypothetical protein